MSNQVYSNKEQKYRTDFDTISAPCAIITSNVNQSIPTGIITPLTFNNEVVNIDNMFDIGSSNNTITIKKAGVYSVTGFFNFASTAVLTLRVGVLTKNGGICANSSSKYTGDVSSHNVCVVDYYNVGDQIQLSALQSTGAPLNTRGASVLSRLGVCLIGNGNF